MATLMPILPYSGVRWFKISLFIGLVTLWHSTFCYTCTGNAVTVQLVPVPDAVLTLPGRNSSAKLDLAFLTGDIPPLGYLQFHVRRTNSRRVLAQQMSSVFTPEPSDELEWVNRQEGVSESNMNGYRVNIGEWTVELRKHIPLFISLNVVNICEELFVYVQHTIRYLILYCINSYSSEPWAGYGHRDWPPQGSSCFGVQWH